MKKAITAIILCLFGASSVLFSDEAKDIAIILKTKGTVKIKSTNPNNWKEARQGLRLTSGDVIKTGDDASTAVMFTDDKSLMKIRENSTVSIQGKRDRSSISKRIKFALGEMWVKVTDQKSSFLVETPSGVAAVKGTEFYTLIDQEGNMIVIGIEGIISLMNKLGEVLIRAGETGLASRLSAPSVRKSSGSEIPNWGNENQETGNSLEFEFQDVDGNKKTIKINYE